MRLIGFVLCCVLIAAGIGACSSTSATATSMTCAASATVASGDANAANASVTLSNVTVTVINAPDSGPFTIALGSAGTVTSTTATYTYPSTLAVTTGPSGGVSQPVTVTDTANTAQVATCSLLAGSLTGLGTPTMGTGTGGVVYTPPIPGSGGTSSVTCTLDRANGVFFIGDSIGYNILSSTGAPVVIVSLDPGEPWSQTPTYPLELPVYISYSTVGAKNLVFYAQTTTGAACNGGQPLTDTLNINSH